MLTIHIFETMRTLVAPFSFSLSLSVCNSSLFLSLQVTLAQLLLHVRTLFQSLLSYCITRKHTHTREFVIQDWSLSLESV